MHSFIKNIKSVSIKMGVDETCTTSFLGEQHVTIFFASARFPGVIFQILKLT